MNQSERTPIGGLALFVLAPAVVAGAGTLLPREAAIPIVAIALLPLVAAASLLRRTAVCAVASAASLAVLIAEPWAGRTPASQEIAIGGVFVVACAGMTWATARLRAAREDAEASARSADARARGERAVMQSLPVAIATFDRELRCTFANDALSDLDSGAVRDGQPIEKALSWAPEQLVRAVRIVLATGDPVVAREASFGERTILFSVHPVHGRDREPSGVCVAVFDITRRAAGERLAHRDRVIAGIVAERAAELLSQTDTATLSRATARLAARVLDAFAECTLRDGDEIVASRSGEASTEPEEIAEEITPRGRVTARRRQSFAASERDALRGIAAYAGIAFDRLRRARDDAVRYEEAVRRAERHEISTISGEALLSSLDLDAVLGRFAESLVPALGDVCIVDVGERRIAGASDPLLGGLIDVAASPQQPCPFEGLTHDPPEGIVRRLPSDPAFAENARLADPISAVAARFDAGDGVAGTLCVLTTRASGRRLGEDDAWIVARMARAVGDATRHARAHRAETEARAHADEAARRLGVVAKAAEQLAESPGLESRMDAAVRTCLDMGELCVLDIVQDDGTARRAAAGAGSLEELALELEIPRSGGDATRRLAELLDARDAAVIGAPEMADFVGALARNDHEHRLLDAITIDHALVVPLRARQRTLGMLSLVCSSPSAQAGQDLRWAEEIARLVAAGVDNAMAYERQRHVAETLQHSLLPERLSAGGRISVAARYLPAGDGSDVGGDWYDVLDLPGEALGIVVGDVMGRGVPAATTMAQLRFALRGYAIEGHPPATVLSWLNRLLLEKMPDEIATLVYAVVDPSAGRLTLCAAGHPAPLLAFADGSVVVLERGRGPALGVGEDAEYVETSTTMPAGSTLLLYTDGLVEDRRAVGDEATRRLRESLRDFGRNLDLLCDRLIVRGLEGRTMDDDVALVLVQVRG